MTNSVKSTKSIGDRAETIAAEFLIKHKNYKVVARNWRTRTAEIDIIAEKDNIITFFEVRYRKNNYFGGGLDSINDRKLDQMYAAAEEWCLTHEYDGDWQVGAVILEGLNFRIVDFIDSFSE